MKFEVGSGGREESRWRQKLMGIVGVIVEASNWEMVGKRVDAGA